MQRSWTGSGKPLRDSALYDSNVLIAYLFREEERFHKAKGALAKHSNRYMSMISIHEIEYYSRKIGVETKFMEIKPKLYKLVRPLQVDQEVCSYAISLRDLEKLPEMDALIAATAIRYGINYLYTFDEDFARLHNRSVQGTVMIKL
ncbi:MAG: hypothetical protein B9J98_03340 [Candidatus Terraquivivens tikiterensis]|uniref:PIN domain-containing protein n=1 Tax=Candidatus Terraquivivens tikiterensis TaxID=1980982 RepID=A0A2R7Y633_9ARCH|nr:MAG: hypothetical protein B9J98_03340 [Candidatus Terraquivivens tikiterensis]